MLYVFWWTGKGYRLPLIVLGCCMIAGFIGQAISPALVDGLPFWGGVLIAAAIPVWLYGRRLNAKAIKALRSPRMQDHLLYRARHKFFSLPFETNALLLVCAGAIMILVGVTRV